MHIYIRSHTLIHIYIHTATYIYTHIHAHIHAFINLSTYMCAGTPTMNAWMPDIFYPRIFCVFRASRNSCFLHRFHASLSPHRTQLCTWIHESSFSVIGHATTPLLGICLRNHSCEQNHVRFMGIMMMVVTYYQKCYSCVFLQANRIVHGIVFVGHDGFFPLSAAKPVKYATPWRTY